MNSGPTPNARHLPLLAALVSVVLWAAAFVGIRAAGRSFSPGPLALGRLAVGSALLGAVVLSRPTIRPTRRELALLVLAGLILGEAPSLIAVLGGALCLVGVAIARRVPITAPAPAGRL